MIDPRSDRAVYRQLADLLRAELAAGTPPPGGQLPSEGQLAHTYGVGRDTVRRALRVLRDEGLIVTERGYRARVHEPEEREPVRVPRGARVVSRPATAAEQAEHEVPEGGHVLVVTVGGRDRLYSADRVVLTFA